MRRTSPEPAEDETLDTFYHGRLLVLQKKRGYRFSLDAPLLADFICTRPSDRLLELGAGNGIISLLLSRKPLRRIVCLEIQPGLADLARRNIALNHLESKASVLERDLRTYRAGEKYDVVFSNPPYIKKKGGQLSPSGEKSIAKHEIKCDIFDIMHVAGKALERDGRACVIYPAKRKADFDRALEENGLKVKALRYVHPRSGEAARWFLAECRFAVSSQEIRPPLFVYDERGEYTPEMQVIFAGEDRGPHSG
ncbi:MAG: methyltransferase [Candidatus Aminicenantales bacterium]